MIPRSTVLIVDDNAASIRMLTKILADDYNLLTADSGEMALAIAVDNKPQLVLLDVMMEGIDGYQVCRTLKSEPNTATIPVIFITALDSVEDETKGFAVGAVDYITKPFQRAVVEARVRTHVDLKVARDELERLSLVDRLTDLATRRRFEDMLASEWRRLEAQGRPLSVVVADIDAFEAFNGTYGFPAGDDCLRRVARYVRDGMARPQDFVGRYEGGKFVGALPEVDHETAVATAHRVRQSVHNLGILHKGSRVSDHVTLSIGVATVVPGRDGADPADLVQRAEQRLDQARKDGGNRVAE